MTLITPHDIVAAARSSTQAYLELLSARPAAAPRYPVDRLKEQHIPVQIEGQLHHRYAAHLPTGLKIRRDAHALFTPKSNGQSPIPARILDYNSHTGMAKLGFREKMEDDAGQLCIEHRQALRRWAAWLDQCAEEPAALDEIEVPTIDIEKALDDTKTENDIITDKQMQAVRTLLGGSLSVVFGPAGSGKTSVVLPRAVRALIAQGKRAIILAWRDEAVDEALTGLILNGVPAESILRLGVPSPPFLRAHPQCCEIHASDQVMGKFSGRAKRLHAQASAAGKLSELKAAADRDSRELAVATRELNEMDRAYREMSETVRRLDMKSRGLHNEFFRSQSKLTGERRKRSELHVPELEREKKLIETEYAFISKTIKTLRQELEGLTGLSGLLAGGKKKDIEDQIVENEHHLKDLTAKMEELNGRMDAREDDYKDITGHIYNDETITGSMDNKLNRMRDKLSELRPQLASLEAEWQKCRARTKALTEAARQSSAALDAYAREHGIEDVEESIRRQNELESDAAKADHQLDECEFKMDDRCIIGMTLDAFINFSVRDLVKPDWVFVDEAHCAPVIKMLPLLALRRPIAMLGDARHLPPWCDPEAGPEVRAWWGKSAIFLEDAFREGQEAAALLALEDPRHEITQSFHLRQSHSIGPRHAALLENHIWTEPLELSGRSDVEIKIRHCEPYRDESLPAGVNESESEEAVAVVLHMLEESGSPDTPISLAILTPGEAQADFIREKLHRRDERLPELVDVLAAHRAQGLAWDHVVFSVTSTRRLGDKSVPPERLCSAKIEGRSLLHTVLTRARKDIIILMDRTDWANNDPPCLLTDLARTGKLYEPAE